MKWLITAAIALVGIIIFLILTPLRLPKGRVFTILTPTEQTLFGRRILSGEVEIFFDKSSGYTNLQTKKTIPCVFILLRVQSEQKEKSDIEYTTDQICIPYPSDIDPTSSDVFSVTYPGGDIEHSWKDSEDAALSVSSHRVLKASLELKKNEKDQYLLKYDYQGIDLDWSNTTFRIEVALDSQGKPIKEDRSLELILVNATWMDTFR